MQLPEVTHLWCLMDFIGNYLSWNQLTTVGLAIWKINIAGRIFQIATLKDMDESLGCFRKMSFIHRRCLLWNDDRIDLIWLKFQYVYIYIYPFQPCRGVSSSSGANLAQWNREDADKSTTATVKTRKKMELPVVLSPKKTADKNSSTHQKNGGMASTANGEWLS